VKSVSKDLSGFRISAFFIISITLIAYELAVMRSFAAGSWSNFGSMVISIALLGNGLAGTLLTFFSKRIRRNINRWLIVTSVLLGPAMSGAYILAQYVPFNPVMISVDWTQFVWISVYYLIYAVPFFIGAVFIGSVFVSLHERIYQIYFWNMVGSGLGGILVLCFIRIDSKWESFYLPPVRSVLTTLAMSVSIGFLVVEGNIKVSEFKPISYARHFPDSPEVYHSYNPAGEIYVYKSSYFHFAPGLSDNASVNVKQMPKNAFLGLYIDGNGPIGIMRKLSTDEEKYIDYLPMSAPYMLRDVAYFRKFTGGYPLVENYTYTSEGIKSYMQSLNPKGILSITVWNRLNPPRNVPKLLTTVIKSLKMQRINNPERHIFVFDSLLSTATILVKKSPFTVSEIHKLLQFLNKISFEACYYPGIQEPEKNFNTILKGYTGQFLILAVPLVEAFGNRSSACTPCVYILGFSGCTYCCYCTLSTCIACIL